MFARRSVCILLAVVATVRLFSVSAAAEEPRRVPPPTPGRVLTAEKDGNCFLVSREGLVITNKHVVSGSHSVLVRFCGSETGFAGVVRDTSEKSDLALIELSDFKRGKADIEPAMFADSTVTLEVGDEVSVSPADRYGNCDAGVFGRILSLRPGSESVNMLSLFSGHSGSALVETESGLVVGVLFASQVAWKDRPEDYLLPPFSFVPVSDICNYLSELDIVYETGHHLPPDSNGRKWFRRLTVLGCAFCGYLSASEYRRADQYYDDYLAAECGNPFEIQALRLSVREHDKAGQYWLGAAIVLGAVALWEYEVPQWAWGKVTGDSE